MMDLEKYRAFVTDFNRDFCQHQELDLRKAGIICLVLYQLYNKHLMVVEKPSANGPEYRAFVADFMLMFYEYVTMTPEEKEVVLNCLNRLYNDHVVVVDDPVSFLRLKVSLLESKVNNLTSTLKSKNKEIRQLKHHNQLLEQNAIEDKFQPPALEQLLHPSTD